MYKLKDKTFKEINEFHDLICIEDVSAITIEQDVALNRDDKIKYYLGFFLKNGSFESKRFDTESEALKFRDEIMGWESDK